MKNFILYFSFAFLAFQSTTNAQNNCYPYPCAPCTIEGQVMTNSTDCGLTNSITVTLINGVAPFTFVIKKAGEDALPPVVQNSPTYTWTNLAPGHYYVWAIDSEGCLWTGECKNLGPLQINIQSVNFCGEENSICTWVEGGTLPYSYSWSTGTQYDCLYDVPTGVYTLTVTDVNGCTEVSSGEVQTSTDVKLNVNAIQPTCEKLGEVNLKAYGGIPPYYFVVRKNGNTGNIAAISSDSLLNIKNITIGTYSVNVSDNAGCNLKGSFVINSQPTKKETQVFLSGCGEVVLPWGEIVNHSGVFVKKYTMTNGCDSTVTAVVTSATSQDSILNIEKHCGSWTAPDGQVFTESGYYLDSILDNNGCQKRLVTGVFIKKPVVKYFTDSYCYGTTPSTIVNGMEYNRDTILVSDCDTVFISFLELPEPKKIKLLDTIFCLSPLSPPLNQEQIMNVVKNTYGCDSIVYYRNLIGVPVVMITDTVTICAGDEFLWNKNNQVYKDQGFYVHVDSSSSCKKYYQLALFEIEPGIVFKQIPTCDSLVWFSLVSGVENCDPDTILLTKLVLNEKLIVESICAGDKFLFQGLEYNLGTYLVSIPGPECDTLVTLIINQSPGIFFSSNIQNIACFGENDGKISLEIFSDDPEITIQWSNGSMEENLPDLPSGIYFITITNSYGCTSGGSFTIVEPEKLVLSLDTTNVTCKGNNGEIRLEVSGGTGPYHFLWNDLYESKNLEDLSFGDYSVVVTDANGCTEIASRILLEPECAPPVSDCEVLVRSMIGSDGPYIEINNDRLNGELTYHIFDEIGILVMNGNFGNISPGYRFAGILSLSNLENGKYVILFTVEGWYSPGFCFILNK